MGVNITRGKPIKYYSSDRIATLLGNGILTFQHEDYQYRDFFTDNEMVFYKSTDELNSKILFYKEKIISEKKLLTMDIKKLIKYLK